MTSCPEAMVLRIGRFFKKSQFGVDFGSCRQRVGISAMKADSWSWGPTMMVRSWVRQWCWEVGVRPWCWEVEVGSGSWDFEVGPWKTIVEFLPLGHRVGFKPLKDVVSLVCLRNQTQKLINGLYLNNGVACVFESAYCVLYPYMYCCDW